MGKQKKLLALFVAMVCWPVMVLANDNPFDKGKTINIGAEWVAGDKTAFVAGSDSGDYYHLFFDLKQLRLRITDSAEDSEVSARQYQQFAVEDVLVDGKRLPVFQWCLVNQERHSRFLQQGLRVKQDVCKNQGEKGAFTMRLNASSLEALKNGKELSFKLKPFRSPVAVNFNIADFSNVVANLVAKPKSKPVVEAGPVVAEPVVVIEQKTCIATAPVEFPGIKPIEYDCADSGAKAAAESSIEVAVTRERERQAELAAEQERKRKEAEAARKAKELATKKAEEERLAAEQAAIEDSKAAMQEMNSDITNKMLAVCQKKWAKGEHRCYCEKFIEHAPPGIESDPSCAK